MKKIILIVAVLLIAAPAMAEVKVEATADGNQVTLTYDAGTAPALPRAFALDIQLDNDAVITEVTDVNPAFNIYPGSIQIDPDTGIVTDPGSPIADCVEYPDVTLCGPNSMTIEMGSLETTPDANGVLCKFRVDKECCVLLSENVARGGIVLEDPDLEADPNLIGGCVTCLCMGDVALDIFGTPGTDGLVNIGDINRIVFAMMMAYPTGDSTYKFEIPIAGLECFDMALDIFGTKGQDNKINIGDVNYLVFQMMMAYPTGDSTYVFEVGCQIIP